MKLPKYGVAAAAALAVMYVLYIIYMLIIGGELNNGEIAMGITFVVCVGAIIAFEFKHRNDHDYDHDHEDTQNDEKE